MHTKIIEEYRKLNAYNQFSCKALSYMLLAELCAVLSMRLWVLLKYYSLVFAAIGIILFFLIIHLYFECKSQANYKFEFRSLIVSKLLANAIVPSWLGALYLFLFVIHIGWLTDGSLNLFLPNAYGTTWEIIASLAVCGTGMAILILFFPLVHENNNGDVTKVFVSGISLISVNENGQYNDNLTPLVKILNEVNENDKFKFLILQSNGYTSKNANVLEGICLYYKKEEEKYNQLFGYTQNTDMGKFERLDIDEQLKKLIALVAKNRFLDKEWLRNEEFFFDIQFTKFAVNYNDFKSCFDILDSEIKDFDKPQYQLYFNLTPGTGIVGSLMTLMSIKGNRKLFYYPQFQGDTQIKEADKSQIPLKNLLSQALENYESEINLFK